VLRDLNDLNCSIVADLGCVVRWQRDLRKTEGSIILLV
jgi:hypothetical protein